MKYQTIVNLLDTASNNGLPRFVIKKWIEVHDQTGINCSVKTPMLRADLCDYYDTYIVVKGVITVTKPDNTKRNKAVALKNSVLFINCISKINNVLIDNSEGLDVLMPLYNLLEYSKNYEKQQVVCGIITEMNQVFLFLLNLLNTKKALQEILIFLLMAMIGMMQKKLVKIKLKLLCH